MQSLRNYVVVGSETGDLIQNDLTRGRFFHECNVKTRQVCPR